MSRSAIFLPLLAALAVSGCNQAEVPEEQKATQTEAPAETAAAGPSALAAAAEPGSGTYAANCMTKDQSYAIALTKDPSNMVVAEVVHAGATLSNQLTSYSFMGDGTPTDFQVAVLFDEGKAPAGVNANEGRIEIWRSETTYYALIDGDKSKRLFFCAV